MITFRLLTALIFVHIHRRQMIPTGCFSMALKSVTGDSSRHWPLFSPKSTNLQSTRESNN